MSSMVRTHLNKRRSSNKRRSNSTRRSYHRNHTIPMKNRHHLPQRHLRGALLIRMREHPVNLDPWVTCGNLEKMIKKI